MNTDNLLKGHGIRPTAVRDLIIRAFKDATGPLSHADIEARLETVDRSSISRAVSLFLDKELIHPIYDGTGTVKYELCHAADGVHTPSDMHPHFHCIRCGATTCLDAVRLPHIDIPEGYVTTAVNFVLTGLCPRCASKEK